MLKDNFLNIFYRRYTHFIHNKKFGNAQRFPGWYITLVFFLYEKLPLSYFKNRGHEGIIRVGFMINKSIRSIYLFINPFAKLLKMLVKFARNCLISLKTFLKIIVNGNDKARKIPVTSKTVNFENTVLYQGMDYSNEHLYLYFERIKKMKGDYLFFVHLFAEKTNDSRDIFYKDSWPVEPIRLWEKGKTITQSIYLGDIPKGYYKIKMGIYNSQTFERLRVEGTSDNSMDLGWRELK
ncbi:hypothetical protein [Psychrobacillus soli]|uniref:Uncharacterized protein n=1 Tax=Psychrobacillus soli TaxID=1543965 RepID=A0A544TL45_9BACI|nr:hypothetical protein [Psychrobacillus soli]TQR18159.1 hypothetical protein FG383_03135 [Psychrobacillus soli]